MRYLSSLLCLVLLATYAPAQVMRGAKWFYGQNSDNNPPHVNTRLIVDFKTGNFQAEWVKSRMDMDNTQTVMCDTVGNLLFYSNGAFIFNRKHKLMLHGDSLHAYPQLDYVDAVLTDSLDAKYYLARGALSLPHPDSSHLYHLLLLSGKYDTRPNSDYAYGWHLRDIIIDMRQDSGYGAVVSKKTIFTGMQINTDETVSLSLTDMTACRHANGRDWWIIKGQFGTLTFRKWLLSPEGVTEQPPQTMVWNDTISADNFYDATTAFSPDGTLFCHTASRYHDGSYGRITLYNFDRCTGALTPKEYFYPPLYNPDSTRKGYVSAGAISANSRYMYQYVRPAIVQYDLWASPVSASAVVIDTFTTSQFTQWIDYVNPLAPDGRIYMFSTQANFVGDTRIHIIENPDVSGENCRFIRDWFVDSIRVDQRTVPNIPWFGLGAAKGTACDTLGLPASYVSVELPVASNQQVRVYPNPARDEVVFTTPSPSYPYGQEGSVGNPLLGGAGVGEVVLHDLLGREVLRKAPRADTALSGVSSMTLDISSLPNGIYLWHCAGQSGKLVIAR